MSNNGVIIAVVSGVFLILSGLVAAWVKRIEGKDRIFRKNITRDMRVMYALKDDYSHLHSWALDVRLEWRQMQSQLKASGAITQIRELPPIPEPEWKRIEDSDDE